MRANAFGQSAQWTQSNMYHKYTPNTIHPDLNALIRLTVACPVSTGILPHSLPEWAFRARPGLWRNCLCPKVARIAERKLAAVRAKLGQTSCFPNGPQIWCPIGQ